MRDCEFIIRDTVEELEFYKFTYKENMDDSEVTHIDKRIVGIKEESIQNDKVVLTLYNYDEINGTMFRYHNKDEEEVYPFAFDF